VIFIRNSENVLLFVFFSFRKNKKQGTRFQKIE
jgi:hypothetical protein